MENQEQKFEQKLGQIEVQYTTVSQNLPETCASCRWFSPDYEYNKCTIVLNNDPFPIVSGGYCDRWEVRIEIDLNTGQPTGETFDPGEPLTLSSDAAAHDDDDDDEHPKKDDEDEDEDEDDKPIFPPSKGVMERIADEFLAVYNRLRSVNKRKQLVGGFKILEDGRWLAWWTNNFEDATGEILTEAALRTFNQRANDGVYPMPELWFSHVPGTRHGITQRLFQVGHFGVAIGVFDDPIINPLVNAMKSWYANQDEVTMSHGFWYALGDKIDDAYREFQTFELSTLRNGREANPYTAFEYPTEVSAMSEVTQEQYDDIEKELGAEMAEFIAGRAKAYGDEVEQRGVSFKGDTTVVTTDDKKIPVTPDAKAISSEGMMVLGALKSIHSDMTENTKEVKDSSNRLDQMEERVGDLKDRMGRMTEAFDNLTRRRPPASKAEETEVPAGDAHADFVQRKNEENSDKMPVFNQMKQMNYDGGAVNLPGYTPPNAKDQNGQQS